MYDAILVPTDGSPGAAVAYDHAIHVAEQNGAVVHAVHVIDVTDLGHVSESDENPRNEGRELLEPILEAAERTALETVAEVLEGTPHERLVEYANEEGVDVIVMGTHGKSGLSRVLLGSTTEKVVRHSPVPVLTVREHRE